MSPVTGLQNPLLDKACQSSSFLPFLSVSTPRGAAGGLTPQGDTAESLPGAPDSPRVRPAPITARGQCLLCLAQDTSPPLQLQGHPALQTYDSIPGANSKTGSDKTQIKTASPSNGACGPQGHTCWAPCKLQHWSLLPMPSPHKVTYPLRAKVMTCCS